MQWTRILDTEAADPAQLAFHSQQFLSAIQSLFAERPPQCVGLFGYTQVVLNVLTTPIVWTVDGKQRAIGSIRGCPENVIKACVDRMAMWVTLATAGVHAEFPSFELSQASERCAGAVGWGWRAGRGGGGGGVSAG